MLVLARKVNERIKIGDDIELTIVSISGDIVRIGIDAPKGLKILRNEVFDDIQRQNQEAVKEAQIQDSVQLLRNIKFPLK